MKKIALMSALLMAGVTTEMALAEEKITFVENKELKTITTKGKYRKPGAPIDMTHTKARVATGEVVDIDVTFSTSLQSGYIEIEVTLDEGLESVNQLSSVTSFELNADKKDYAMKFSVLAKKDGLYYIRLLGKAGEGESIRMRSFAIPVYVGDGQLQKKGKQTIMKVMGGENLSISTAEETIEYVK